MTSANSMPEHEDYRQRSFTGGIPQTRAPRVRCVDKSRAERLSRKARKGRSRWWKNRREGVIKGTQGRIVLKPPRNLMSKKSYSTWAEGEQPILDQKNGVPREGTKRRTFSAKEACGREEPGLACWGGGRSRQVKGEWRGKGGFIKRGEKTDPCVSQAGSERKTVSPAKGSEKGGKGRTLA